MGGKYYNDNLYEIYIEKYLYENPSLIGFGTHVIDRWIGRQVNVPSGKIDLLGVVNTRFGERFVVAEIKNSDGKPAHLTQVCRYAKDLDEVILASSRKEVFTVGRLLITTGRIDKRLLWEANSVDVEIWQIKVITKIGYPSCPEMIERVDSLGRCEFIDEYLNSLNSEYKKLAELEIFQCQIAE